LPHNTCLDSSSEQSLAWFREVRAQLERHPRAAWRQAPSPAARFWLDIHDGFRRESGSLVALLDAHRGDRAAELAVISGRRLESMIARLHGHHAVEDFEYFPAFRALAPKLAGGLDLLASDHARLHRRIDEALAALSELLATVENNAAATPWAADRYASRTGELCRTLARHLDDEEDLIIPLLLERT
jgi:hypothetical protein